MAIKGTLKTMHMTDLLQFLAAGRKAPSNSIRAKSPNRSTSKTA
jgi:hypothetical protein